MSLFINAMLPFTYDGNNNVKKSEAKAEMLQKRLWLKVELHCSPAESPFSDQGVLGANTMKDNTQKRISHNKRDRNSA